MGSRRGEEAEEADHEALSSPLMAIPRIGVAAVRDLLDSGFRQVHELAGRAPEVIFEEVRGRDPKTPAARLAVFRMAVYYAETPEPDPALLQPWAWED